MADKSEKEKVSLRLPEKMKSELKEIAEKENRSFNQQATVFLESAIKEHQSMAA